MKKYFRVILSTLTIFIATAVQAGELDQNLSDADEGAGGLVRTGCNCLCQWEEHEFGPDQYYVGHYAACIPVWVQQQ